MKHMIFKHSTYNILIYRHGHHGPGKYIFQNWILYDGCFSSIVNTIQATILFETNIKPAFGGEAYLQTKCLFQTCWICFDNKSLIMSIWYISAISIPSFRSGIRLNNPIIHVFDLWGFITIFWFSNVFPILLDNCDLSLRHNHKIFWLITWCATKSTWRAIHRYSRR